MRKYLVLTMFALFLFSTISANAQDKTYKYVGVKKCKMCHKSKKSGEQFKIWSEGPHAKALKSLGSPESLEYAKKNGIADPTKEVKCLKCHSTAATVDKALLTKTITVEEGVSCESCHGPGSVYKKNKIMKDQAMSLANGLVLPTEKVCVTCHNEKNPFHKPFDFKTAVAKVSHPKPKKQ